MRVLFTSSVVINHKTTKFESNSQQLNLPLYLPLSCYQSQNYKIWKQFTTVWRNKSHTITVVINHKTTKFESNSQLYRSISNCSLGCYQSQNYKIWKQFTTYEKYTYQRLELLSITKLQNLKAIHNNFLALFLKSQVVINHKTTKFESNSQLETLIIVLLLGCYQSQNYKIWKQFTTQPRAICYLQLLLSITKLQNLKAIHNK